MFALVEGRVVHALIECPLFCFQRFDPTGELLQLALFTVTELARHGCLRFIPGGCRLLQLACGLADGFGLRLALASVRVAPN